MKPGSLIASAAVNFGSALVVLSFFSILKKQPSNAPIYYASRLSKRHPVPPTTVCRFLPSVSWIPRAFRLNEDEILELNGLDVLIIIRLFNFGVKFFGVCSIVGLTVLLPINYGAAKDDAQATMIRHSMDPFSISNVRSGSNSLWVHFACLCFISFYGLYLLYKEYDAILVKRIQQLKRSRHRPDQFTVLVRQIPFCIEHKNQANHIVRRIESLRQKSPTRQRSTVRKFDQECLLWDASQEDVKIAMYEGKLQELSHKIHELQGQNILKSKELPVAFATFKSRCSAALVAQSQQHSHPLLWITEMAPEPRDVSWRSLAIPVKILLLYKIGVIVLASLLTIFFAVPVTAVQGIAKFEKLKQWFPPARAVELIPGLSSIITGYIPSAILNAFIYVVPFAMLALAKFSGSNSKSKEEIKACNMVFYFLLGNVFFLSLISGSLLDEIGQSFTQPKNCPSRLARAVSAQADFFMTYILTDGLSGFSLEILQPGLLLWDCIMLHTCGRGREENPYLYSLPYFRIIPFVSLSILIGLVYAVVAPLLLPVLIGYFCLGYVVYVNQIEDVYVTAYETCGKYWPYVHHYIFIGIIIMQITMIGLFGLKSKPAASIATIPLLLLTALFNEYCKIHFLPTFNHYSIQDAAEIDELDHKSGQMEANCERASNAYRPPSLSLLNFLIRSESRFTQLLVASL